jgi:hypothetical protein
MQRVLQLLCLLCSTFRSLSSAWMPLPLLALLNALLLLCVAGGLFELVSCPHYLAEVVIYCGLVLATGGQLLPLLMLVWVVSHAAGITLS